VSPTGLLHSSWRSCSVKTRPDFFRGAFSYSLAPCPYRKSAPERTLFFPSTHQLSSLWITSVPSFASVVSSRYPSILPIISFRRCFCIYCFLSCWIEVFQSTYVPTSQIISFAASHLWVDAMRLNINPQRNPSFWPLLHVPDLPTGTSQSLSAIIATGARAGHYPTRPLSHTDSSWQPECAFASKLSTKLQCRARAQRPCVLFIFHLPDLLILTIIVGWLVLLFPDLKSSARFFPSRHHHLWI
jgi:hypothetical protein